MKRLRERMRRIRQWLWWVLTGCAVAVKTNAASLMATGALVSFAVGLALWVHVPCSLVVTGGMVFSIMVITRMRG